MTSLIQCLYLHIPFTCTSRTRLCTCKCNLGANIGQLTIQLKHVTLLFGWLEKLYSTCLVGYPIRQHSVSARLRIMSGL